MFPMCACGARSYDQWHAAPVRLSLYPEPGQARALALALARAFGCARVVYNDAVRARRDAHANGWPYPSKQEATKSPPVTEPRSGTATGRDGLNPHPSGWGACQFLKGHPRAPAAPRQEWCTPSCRNRVRVARHHERHKKTA
jgi:hypothetical protein